jgi:hypothetical protein
MGTGINPIGRLGTNPNPMIIASNNAIFVILRASNRINFTSKFGIPTEQLNYLIPKTLFINHF